jgi:hypothetical protein
LILPKHWQSLFPVGFILPGSLAVTVLGRFDPFSWGGRLTYFAAMSVSIEHEAPIELCHRHPQLVLRLLGLCGQELPSSVVAEPQPTSFNQPVVEEWRADGAMLLKQAQVPVGAGGHRGSSASPTPPSA